MVVTLFSGCRYAASWNDLEFENLVNGYISETVRSMKLILDRDIS